MINAIIFLNDDNESVSGSCSNAGGFENNHGHYSNKNLYFLLSVSAPKPLFPVAGYPLIYHHCRALAEISAVRNVFLVGSYKSSAFNGFIESLYDEFSFSTVQYINEETPNNEAGILFKYRKDLLKDDPDYFICMRYQICSSFPLQKMIAFNKELEKAAKLRYENKKKSLELDGSADNTEELRKLKLTMPLVLLLGTERTSMYGEVQGSTIVADQSGQILHISDNPEFTHATDKVNAGIYLISASIYDEFDSLEIDEQYTIFGGEDASVNMLSKLGDMYDNVFDIESSYDCSRGRSQSIGGAFARDNYSASAKVNSALALQQNPSVHLTHASGITVTEVQLQRFSQNFKYVNQIGLAISLKDILMASAIHNQQKAFVYNIEPSDFLKTITRHEDKLVCQHMYFNYYSQVSPSLMKVTELTQEEQVIGNVHIHPDADVHHTAIIGPNVSIGAKAKIHPGCRISNSIILEDVEIQAHSVVMFSLVGWNSKVGPWCRLEGSMTTEHNDSKQSGRNQGQKFDVCVLGHGCSVFPETMLRDCLVMPMREINKSQTNMIIF